MYIYIYLSLSLSLPLFLYIYIYIYSYICHVLIGAGLLLRAAAYPTLWSPEGLEGAGPDAPGSIARRGGRGGIPPGRSEEWFRSHVASSDTRETH